MASTASIDKMTTNIASTPTNEMSTPPLQTPTQMPTSTHPLDDGFLNLILPIPIDAAGKLKQMLGWKTLVDNYEMSFGLLMILNEQRAHIATTKKEYDDLMKIVFEGQLNSNGVCVRNALFQQHQKWIGQYANRKLKTLCNRVINFFANNINMCELYELCGLAKKSKEEQDTVAKERAEHHLQKSKLKML